MRTSLLNSKKIAADVHGEVEKEIGRIVDHYVKERAASVRFDLESFEMSRGIPLDLTNK